jgi:uncharacterized protein YbjT (DUF2867 family)
MILVAGATGYLGGLVIDKLLARGERVRALVRAGRDFHRPGVEIAQGDLKDRASLDAACRGIEVVVTTANSAQRGGDDNPASVDHQGNVNLIDAAKATGVQQFVFVSVAHVDPASPVPLFAAKAKVEAHLKSSGMTWTIIAPHVFMDVWFRHIIVSAINAQRPVALVGGGQKRHSFIAIDDVAEFTVAAVRHPAARNQRLVLGGPAALSWTDVVAKSSDVAGRKLSIESVPPGQPIPTLPAPVNQVIGNLMAGLEQQDVILDTTAAAKTFGVTLTPAESVLRRLL